MTSLRWNIMAVILLGILLFLQYHLWFAADGIHDMVQLKKTLALQAKENKFFKKRNEELLFQIQRLQNSQDEVESRARNELGMIKEGEIFYQIVE
jgi:cell division protein FtsB